MSDVNASIIFELKSGKIELNGNDLEIIKQSLISFIKQAQEEFSPYIEFQDILLMEAEKLPCWIDNNVAHIGHWILQVKNDIFVLVRHPHRSEIMYVFIATLSRKNSSWQIRNFSHERQVAR